MQAHQSIVKYEVLPGKRTFLSAVFSFEHPNLFAGAPSRREEGRRRIDVIKRYNVRDKLSCHCKIPCRMTWGMAIDIGAAHNVHVRIPDYAAASQRSLQDDRLGIPALCHGVTIFVVRRQLLSSFTDTVGAIDSAAIA